MTELRCKDCGNKEKFIATYVYKCLVDFKGDELTTPEMYEEPEYQCDECNSTNIEIAVLL